MKDYCKYLMKCWTEVKKIVSIVLIFSMLAPNLTHITYAEEIPNYIPELTVEESLIDDGMFYLASDVVEINESDDSKHILKVKRKGDCQTKEKVRLTMNDMNAKYGKDYKIKVYGGTFLSEKVENADKAKSIVEYIKENEHTEYNYSDAVVEGVINADNQVKEGDKQVVTDAEKEQMMQDVNDYLAELNMTKNVQVEDVNKKSQLKKTKREHKREHSKKSNINNKEKLLGDGVSQDNKKQQEKQQKEMQNELVLASDSVAEEVVYEDDKNEDISLTEAWEIATGLEYDRPVAIEDDDYDYASDNSVEATPFLSDGIKEVSKELNSAYIILNFEIGQSEKLIEIDVLDDKVWTGDKQVGFNLEEVDGSKVAGAYSGFTLHIVDNEEELPTYINFEKESYYPEDGYITVKVVRSGNATSIATCMIDTEDMTAKKTINYSQVHAKLIFGFGIDERIVKIPVISEGLNETVEFKIKLQEPQGALIGDKNVAYGYIEKDSKSLIEKPKKEPTLLMAGNDRAVVGIDSDKAIVRAKLLGESYGLNDVITDNPLQIKDTIYDKANGGNSSSYQRQYGTNGWEMYVEDHSFAGDTVSSYFLAKLDGGYDRYDYAGVQVQMSKDQENGRIEIGYFDYNINKWVYPYDKNRETFTNKVVNVFYNYANPAYYDVWLTRYDGMWRKSPTLKIEYIKPIKRMFEISLLGAECPTVINEEGNIVPTGQISAYKDLHIAELKGGASGKLVSWAGNTVTVSLKNSINNILYIAGIEIVDDKNNARTIVSNNDVNRLSLSFILDNNLIRNNKDLIKFVTRKADGGGMTGAFSIRPILRVKPAKIRIMDDNRVDIKIWNDKPDCQRSGVRGTNWTEYTYNMGDTINYKEYIKEEYKDAFICNALRRKVLIPSGKEDIDLVKTGGKNYFLNVVDYEQISITPQVSQKDNVLVVRVLKSDVDKFDQNFGIFTINGGKRYDNDKYYDYIISSDADSIAGKMFELNVKFRKGYENLVAIWKENYASTEYAQNTYCYEGKEQKINNIVELRTEVADDIPYSIAGKVYYEDVPIGGRSTSPSWQLAPYVSVVVDYAHFGMSDEKGEFITYPIKSKAGKAIKYKVVHNGIASYGTVTLSKAPTVTKKYKFEYQDGEVREITMTSYNINIGQITISNNDKTHPYVRSIEIKNNKGVTDNFIHINDKLTQLIAYIQPIDPNTNKEFTYKYKKEDGTEVEEVEHLKYVEFVIRDGTNNNEKLVIPATLSNVETEWMAFKGFERGNYNEYKADDKLYVRVVTDRKVGDGTCYDTDGKKRGLPFFNETKYPCIYTNVSVVEDSEQKPVLIDIELPEPENEDTLLMADGVVQKYKLPIIGDMSTMINFKGMSFGVQGEGDRVRLFFGKCLKGKGSRFDGNGKGTADNGIHYDCDNFTESFDEMKDMINSMGKKRLGTMTIGIPSWKFEPIIGVYFEFGLKYNVKSQTFGKFEFLAGGAYVGFIANFRFTFYFMLVSIPCYVGGDVNVTVLGEFGVAKDKNDITVLDDDADQSFFDELIHNNHFEHIFRAQIVGSAYVGVGLCGVLGVRGGFAITLNFIASPMAYKKYGKIHSFGFAVTGSINFWVDALLLSIPIPVYKWPRPYKQGYFKDLEERKKRGDLLTAGDEKKETWGKLKSRPRSSKESSFTANNKMLKSTYGGNVTEPIIKDVYDDSKPKVMKINDNEILMVYLDDDKAREDIERTILKYMIYDYNTGKWTDPQPVQPDGTADFTPYLCDCDDEIFLTWTSRNERLEFMSAEEDYAKVINSMEVYATRFDKKTKTFTNIERITEDKYYDYYPKAMYNDKDKIIVLCYLKANVKEVKDSKAYIEAIQTEKNDAMIMYIAYDKNKGEWIRDVYEDVESDEAKKLLSSFNGQQFIQSVIKVNDNGEVINSPCISEYAIGATDIYDIDKDEFNSIRAKYSELDEDAKSLAKQNMSAYLSDKLKHYSVYAFESNLSNNLKDKKDTEIYVQFYNSATNKFTDTIRITENNVPDTSPKIITNDNDTYLLWLQNESMIKAISLKELLIDMVDKEKEPGGEVKLSSTDKLIDGASLNDFYPFVDEKGQMYIIWQENSNDINEQVNNAANGNIDFKQDLYISGFYEATDKEGKKYHVWSKTNRLTDNKKLNNLPDALILPDGKLFLVNNEYNLVSKGGKYDEDGKDGKDGEHSTYEITNSELNSIICERVSSVSIESVTSTLVASPSLPLKDGEKQYFVNVIARNDGLSYLEGVVLDGDINVDGKIIAPFEHEVITCYVAPGDTGMVSRNIVLPEDVQHKLDEVMLDIEIKEVDTEGEPKKYHLNVFDAKEKYEFSKINSENINNYDILGVEQDGDKFIVSGVVANVGNVDGKGNEHIVVAENGDLQKIIYKTDVVSLKMNERSQFVIELNDEMLDLESGYRDLVLYVINDKDERLSNYELVSLSVKNPYDFVINENEKLVVKAGKTLTLNAEYEPKEKFANATMIYAIKDNDIARVENGVLKGLKQGSTKLLMTTKEYGGTASVDVVVEKGDDPSPTPGPTPTPKPTPINRGGGSGGSGGGGGSGSTISMSQPVEEIKVPVKEEAIEIMPRGIDFKIALGFCTWIKNIFNTWNLKMNYMGFEAYAGNGFVDVITATLDRTALVDNIYCFDKDGNMITGWAKDTFGNYYFFDYLPDANEGKMVVGWKKVADKWYYFGVDGKMLVNTFTPDGQIVGADGSWVTIN